MFLITFFRPVHKYTYFQLNINNSVTSMAKTPSGRFCDLHVSFSKLSIYRPKSVFFANMDHMCCQRSLFGGVSKHLRFPMKLSHFYWRRIASHIFNFSSFFENVALVATRATFLRPRPFFVFVFELSNMKIDLSLMVFDMFWKTNQKTSRFLITFWPVIFDLEFVTFGAFLISRIGAIC